MTPNMCSAGIFAVLIVSKDVGFLLILSLEHLPSGGAEGEGPRAPRDELDSFSQLSVLWCEKPGRVFPARGTDLLILLPEK